MANKYGQISIEFIFAVGAVLLIFLVILAFSFDKANDIRRFKRENELLDECNKISNAILTATIIGDKGSVIIETSKTINIFDYGLISVSDEEASVECNYIGKIDTLVGLSGTITLTYV